MRRSYLQWLFSATLVRLNIPVQYKQVSGSILKLLQQTTDRQQTTDNDRQQQRTATRKNNNTNTNKNKGAWLRTTRKQ